MSSAQNWPKTGRFLTLITYRLLACGSIAPSDMMPFRSSGHRVVCIGGGTGSPQLLVELRERIPDACFSIVVPVTDTGRSTGAARRIFKIPGPGDLRHCLTALAGSDSPWSRLLEMRLAVDNEAHLQGMAIGNLVLGALAHESGDIGRAAVTLSRMLTVKEKVMPVSIEDIHLAARLEDGAIVSGEIEVRRPGKQPIRTVMVEGEKEGIWAPVAGELVSASAIILGPGSLWTSLGGVLAVRGVREAINASSAQIIFVCNTTSQPGQTDDMNVKDHVEVVSGLAGRPPDSVIVNSEQLSSSRQAELAEDGLKLLTPSEFEIRQVEAEGSRVVSAGLLAVESAKPELWQKLHTAYHDMEKLAEIIADLIIEPRDAAVSIT